MVAIADGFGAAYDPEGLNWEELLRLVSEGHSIKEFSKERLSGSDEAFVINADTTENIRTRNQMHAVTLSDIFIPAGGRPYTVTDQTCDSFFTGDKNSEPTCKAIIEGANIFFTDEAREILQNRGIIMIKDSSANKTGVICSSYEIIASLLLSPEEFAEIKETYVAQVIEILRHKAALEADLLLREFASQAGKYNLVELSKMISTEINDVTDLLLEVFSKDPQSMLDEPRLGNLIFRHCPEILQKEYKQRIESNLPLAHKVAIVSAYIASYVVYREGLGWLHGILKEERCKAAIAYIKQDLLTEELISSVLKTEIQNRDLIADILRNSGARNLTMRDLRRDQT